MLMTQLPTLGLGISLSLSAQPDPVTIIKNSAISFVEYAGLVDVARVWPDVKRIQNAGATVLYHPSYINFCGSFANQAHWLRQTAEHIQQVGSAWFAQDCAYCFWQQEQGYSTQLGYFIPPILNEQSLAQAIVRVKEVQALVPVVVAIEPPPMLFVVGDMPLWTFFQRLAEATDCAILLDMGHLVSYELASGLNIREHLQAFAPERVIEVHIAGGRLEQQADGEMYIDAHEYPILEQTWQMLAKVLPHLPHLKAVCYECEGMSQEAVLSTLSRLKQTVETYSINAELVAHIRAKS
ncbi:DUF692 family multinuclear iron-containing protein [Agitococcus lubricus]|uniref:Uncharacterized protein DUF692 n=1 Tax=Agitococcus lubricus TaxID=1077255 RepID=A0A2T5J3V6_9GAMM|nr:DUF692 family multinuclear iron-containing protein [Agitococcus lubricus]PTQ91299.1 uncharacterized protein DUF692 [Agitococcus lubricus]